MKSDIKDSLIFKKNLLLIMKKSMEKGNKREVVK